MKTTLQFLKKLAKNNDREWFKAHREEYLACEEEFKTFAHDLAQIMKSHDQIDDTGTKVFRIYRDVRFSNDKTPYTKHRSASFKRATDALRGGYYLKVQPGESFIAGGFWGPNSQDLLHMRSQIELDPEPLREVLDSKEIKAYFGELQGEQVKTAPKGFSKESPAIDLLRYKQFVFTHRFTDQEVLADNFIHTVSDGFKKMRPFYDYMTEILTTDLNGVSLLKE